MSKELKPCPFCGGEPFGPKFEYESGRFDIYSVECPACDYSVEGGVFKEGDEAKDAVTRFWNTRTSHLPDREEVARVREAVEMFARLEIPAKPDGNAGFYSIPFVRIQRAKEALATCDRILAMMEGRG